MKKLLTVIIFAVLIALVTSCAQPVRLYPPGLKDFKREIMSEYPYVKDIKCISIIPPSFKVNCYVSYRISPEQAADLTAKLQEYALTDVMETYSRVEGGGDVARDVFVDYVNKSQHYLTYEYQPKDSNPEWKLR
ncbi:MAG: hypothetical protein LBN00_10475 [Oscillospiraceae bacterium]|jgi:hypothetical protein|nr:hypothetical protein [Oscillospiraceae bacterium]